MSIEYWSEPNGTGVNPAKIEAQPIDDSWVCEICGEHFNSGKEAHVSCGAKMACEACRNAPFSVGIHRDEGKPRMDLLPGDALIEAAKAMSPGIGFELNKYPSRNWELGLKWGDLFGSTQRHLWQWHMRQGTNDSGLTHLAHAAACCLMLLASELRQIGEDDRPKLK